MPNMQEVEAPVGEDDALPFALASDPLARELIPGEDFLARHVHSPHSRGALLDHREAHRGSHRRAHLAHDRGAARFASVAASSKKQRRPPGRARAWQTPCRPRRPRHTPPPAPPNRAVPVVGEEHHPRLPRVTRAHPAPARAHHLPGLAQGPPSSGRRRPSAAASASRWFNVTAVAHARRSRFGGFRVRAVTESPRGRREAHRGWAARRVLSRPCRNRRRGTALRAPGQPPSGSRASDPPIRAGERLPALAVDGDHLLGVRDDARRSASSN